LAQMSPYIPGNAKLTAGADTSSHELKLVCSPVHSI